MIIVFTEVVMKNHKTRQLLPGFYYDFKKVRVNYNNPFV
jgi:hypothetical protein